MAMLKTIRLPVHVAQLPECHPEHARALTALDQHARDRGVWLYPQTDFTVLRRFFSGHVDSGARLAPLYDPDHHALTPDDAFWVAGLDQGGDVVMTAAIRIIDCASLREEAETMRLFGPGHFRAATFAGPAASKIRGRVAISGGGWVHPRFRGPGLTGIRLSRLLRRAVTFLAYAMKPLDYDAAWVKTVQVVEKGLAADYGFDHVEHGADFVMADGSISPNSLVWSDTYQIDEDMAWCARGALRRPMPMVSKFAA